MARKSHKLTEESDRVEGIIDERISLALPRHLVEFLDIEAKKLTIKRGKFVRKGDIVRALIVAYYEKRIANLLVSPDD